MMILGPALGLGMAKRATLCASFLLLSGLALVLCQGRAEAAWAAMDATSPSSPIEISNLSYGADSDNQLFFVYGNRSKETVEQFQITGSWLNAAHHVIGRFRRAVVMQIGPGERTTVTMDDLPSAPPHASLKIAVTRARFRDLSVWVAPAVAPVVATQPKALPVYVTPARASNRKAGSSSAVAFVAHPQPFEFAPLQLSPILPPHAATLPEGTPLDVSVAASVDSQRAQNGSVVPFIVAHDVVVEGMAAIQHGAIGYGHLTDVGRAANWGRSGSLTLVADAVQAADGSMIEVRGAEVVAPARVRPSALAQLSVIGAMLVHGIDATLAQGTIVQVTCAKTSRIAYRQ